MMESCRDSKDTDPKTSLGVSLLSLLSLSSVKASDDGISSKVNSQTLPVSARSALRAADPAEEAKVCTEHAQAQPQTARSQMSTVSSGLSLAAQCDGSSCGGSFYGENMTQLSSCPSCPPSCPCSPKSVHDTNTGEMSELGPVMAFKLDLDCLVSPTMHAQVVDLFNSQISRSYSIDELEHRGNSAILKDLDATGRTLSEEDDPTVHIDKQTDGTGVCSGDIEMGLDSEHTHSKFVFNGSAYVQAFRRYVRYFAGRGGANSMWSDNSSTHSLGSRDDIGDRDSNNKQKTSLDEKLRMLESGHLKDETVVRRMAEFNRLVSSLEDYERKKRLVMSYKYATDKSYYLRNRITPDMLWDMIKRREAWNQGSHVMIGITMIQVMISFVVLLTRNSPINNSCIFVSILYLAALALFNPFELTKDCFHACHRYYVTRIAINMSLRNYCWVLTAFCWPVLFSGIGMLFLFTMMLDLVAGKMNNISSCELLRIIVNFIVVFSGLSVGLRSGNAVGAIQTLAGKIVAKVMRLFVHFTLVVLNRVRLYWAAGQVSD
jgi:hypothetical protein